MRTYLLAFCAAGAFVAAPRRATAEPTDADPHASEQADVMHALADRGWHDLGDEAWTLHGQLTVIDNYKPAFSAPYTNANGSTHSLSPNAESSYTMTLTLFAGLRPWRGGEVFIVPELLGEVPLSDLVGLGGAIQNAELQKTGSASPAPYLSRAYLRQTIDLGGAAVAVESGPLQLGQTVQRRRLVLWGGMLSILDVMDKNSLAGDLRRQFLNMDFLTYAAYDFAADARGYSWGGIAELYLDDWTVRAGRLAPPRVPNQLPLDFRIWEHYGDQVEVEHRHALGGHPGVVRVLGYRNREIMARFDDAIAIHAADPTKNAATCDSGGHFNYGSTNATAPDLCWARAPNTKVGAGINVEQEVAEHVGVFLRAMISDGETEVYSFTSADRSLALGALATGERWGRRWDSAGIAYAQAWISGSHAAYLAAGGVDGFIGDGHLRQASERVLEAFYSVGLWRAVWLSPDIQVIWNPGYNADRGPVPVLGGRFHGEF